MLKLLITGTGRCGTGYMSKIVSKYLCPCGHEEVFTPGGFIAGNAIAESSWLAAPFVGGLNCTKVHVVREPQLVLNSLSIIPGLFNGPLNPWGKWVHQVLNLEPGDKDNVVRFYCTWHMMLEGIDIVRLEDLTTVGGLDTFIRSIGEPLCPVDDLLDVRYNSGPRSSVDYVVSDRWKESYNVICEQHGYPTHR